MFIVVPICYALEGPFVLFIRGVHSRTFNQVLGLQAFGTIGQISKLAEGHFLCIISHD